MKNYIYYIRDNNEPIVSFGIKDHHDKLDHKIVNFMKNLEGDSAKEALNGLEQCMEQLGAVIHHNDTDETYAFSFSFKNVAKARCDYFMPRLADLKKQVGALSLSDVIRADPTLTFIENSKHSDIVSGLKVYDMSFNDFIRHLKSGTTYYVHRRVILMHD